MKYLLAAALVFFLFAKATTAQTPASDPVYAHLVDTAFLLLKADRCGPCLAFYEEAFQRSRHSALSHLRAALCAERCGDIQKAENLSLQAVLINWSVCEKVLRDPYNYPEFKPVAGTPFGAGVFEKIRVQAEALGIDLTLKAELEKIHADDQKYRNTSNPYQPGSPEYIAFVDTVQRTDSLNMARVEEIIQWYGYPGKSKVGEEQASTAWLVIQHAPLEKQEQYFPLIEAAAQQGEIRKSDWALLLDRIRMRKGLPQVYGSQIVRDPNSGAWIVHPIENEADVDKRRAEIGLEPLEDYALRFGIVWKPK